jgi:hypothetical protein
MTVVVRVRRHFLIATPESLIVAPLRTSISIAIPRNVARRAMVRPQIPLSLPRLFTAVPMPCSRLPSTQIPMPARNFNSTMGLLPPVHQCPQVFFRLHSLPRRRPFPPRCHPRHRHQSGGTPEGRRRRHHRISAIILAWGVIRPRCRRVFAANACSSRGVDRVAPLVPADRVSGM